jgi:hypothetical protein
MLFGRNDTELAVKRAKRLEKMLRQGLGAQGRGLHELVSSVARELPDPLERRLRFIATIRNKIVHEEDYQRIDDRRGFIDACDQAEAELKSLARRGAKRGCLARAAVFVVAVGGGTVLMTMV